jgi:hypothetical protein
VEDSILCISESAGVKKFCALQYFFKHEKSRKIQREYVYIIWRYTQNIHKQLVHTSKTGEKQREKKEKEQRISVPIQ